MTLTLLQASTNIFAGHLNLNTAAVAGAVFSVRR